MNKSSRSLADFFTLETALYLLAFVIALALRLLNLGQSPLTDGEANLALQALQVARPGTAAHSIDHSRWDQSIPLFQRREDQLSRDGKE